MSTALFYRVASVLLLLFAVGHTLGFRNLDPNWGVDSPVASMQTVHLAAQGFNRTYYDFYVGFGLYVSVLLLFIATVAWQLGALRRQALALIPLIKWGLVACFLVVVALSWNYFFLALLVCSIVIPIFLAMGALFSGNL